MKRSRLFGIFALVFWLAACSGVATPLPPTQAPPSLPPPSQLTPTAASLIDLGTWDVVIIGDSSLWGVGEAIAAHIEQDYGITVNLHDFTISNLTAKQALAALSSSNPDTPNARLHGWPEILAEAEYILLHPSPAESISPTDAGDWSCMYPPYYVESCALATFDQYQSDLTAILHAILALRHDQPVIVRFGSYWGRPGNWGDSATGSACMACLETDAQAVGMVASQFHIPFAPVLDVFNSPGHNQEPQDLGFIGEDGVHASQVGAQAIADQIWELGIEPIQP